MKIAHFSVKDREQQYLFTKLCDHENLFFGDNDIAANLEKIKDVEVLDVFIYDKVTKEIIEQLPNLKLITTRSTGFDHIDLIAAKDKNIMVTNVPSYGENTVAEHTFALLLALSKNIYSQVSRTRLGNFEYQDLPGFDLSKKTLGIIGTGHIGMHVIKIAKGFGMEIIAFDIVKNHFLAEVFGFKYVQKKELFAQADIISLHAPYNKHTHHILDTTAFENMKTGVTILNTSRGGLIDTAALISSLDSHKVGGAGLDVLENEQELLKNGKNSSLFDLITRQNVIFTPHTAYYTIDAENRILETTAENILGARGDKAGNLVGERG